MSPVLDLRSQPPLEDELRERLSEEIDRRIAEDGAKTAGQTLLSHADLCPRSAALYLIFGGGTESHATARGTLAHLFDEQMRDYLLNQGETSMPPEVAKDRMVALIGERTDLVVPEHEQEALRIYAWNSGWASTVDPATMTCNETTFALELAGWTVRGRIDRADQLPDRTVLITDRKSGLALPAQEDYESGPASFQPKTYALLYAFGVDEHGMRLGEGVPSFRTRVELPRRMSEDTGELAYREAEFSHAQLHDFRETLERLLGVLDHGLESGEFRAASGSHCAYCPAAANCPIDARYRTLPGEQGPPRPIPSVASVAEAHRLAEEKLFLDARSSGLQRALREWAKDNGPIHFADDLVMDFAYSEGRGIKDFDALEAAIVRTTELGEPFDLSDHVVVRRSTPFRKRKAKRGE